MSTQPRAASHERKCLTWKIRNRPNRKKATGRKLKRCKKKKALKTKAVTAILRGTRKDIALLKQEYNHPKRSVQRTKTVLEN